MANAGAHLHNPVTGEQLVFRRTGAETEGELRGTTVVRGNGIRQDGLIGLLRASGMFALPPRERELAGWLRDLGLEDVSVDTSGALAFFSGRKP